MAKPLILVVDDHEYMQQALVNILRLADINSITAETGEEALDKLQRFRPGLVLLDLNLRGDMTGLDVLYSIRNDSQLAETPVVLLTADELAMTTTQTLPADLVLLKPVDAGHLVTLVERLLMQASQRASAG